MRRAHVRGVAAAFALTVVACTPAGAAAKPDLVVRSVGATPRAVAAGGTLTVTDATVNTGRARAGTSSTGYTLVGRQRVIRLGSRLVPALKGRRESRGETAVTVPGTARDGIYRVVACADARGDVREERERNNCRIGFRRIVIDSVAPAVPTVSERPDAATRSTAVRIAFSHAQRRVTFACQFDGGAETACVSPFEASGLAEGPHRFAVRAIDAAGNRGPAAVVEWTVDLTPPAPPVIDERPAEVSVANRARFAFHANEPGVRFRCALDGAQASACESPVEFGALADEEHVFTVLAVDAAGNASEPVEASWTVVPRQATLGDGAWCWFADPRAVRFNRRTYVGWTARNGDIELAAYDHDSLVRTTARLRNEKPIDDHNNPVIQILPDRRVRVYWSVHGGPELWYRTSLEPEDITAWGPLRRVGTTTAGEHGYSYPNPVHLSAEGATYLFWRGGNWNPTFSVQLDGEDAWRPAANVVYLEGQRPYMKVASNGVDRIGFAYTDGHPAELDDVNIHYAEYRSGAGLFTAGGQRIGALGDPVAPTAGDTVHDPPFKTWVHDVAFDAAGRPVIVFAGFPTEDDHRYFYARWTGETWDVHEIVAAGGSILTEDGQPFYSGGITLDHESTDTVYLARTVDGVFEVERWSTPDGGTTWTSTAITAASPESNVRPVSPRGLIPFSSDLSVIWMRGLYPHYLRFQTSMTTVLATRGNLAPVASVTTTPSDGSGPLTVALDASASTDPEHGALTYAWDLGDAGATAAGERVTHRFRAPGTYFPRVTVTDEAGASDVYVAEVTVGAWQPVEVGAGLAWTGEDGDVTVSGTVNGHNQATTYHFEYGIDALDRRTPDESLQELDHAEQLVTARIAGLATGTTVRYRIVATNETGTATGPERSYTVRAPGGSAYRSAVLSTPGVLGYWRLGETAGPAAANETGGDAGVYSAQGVTLAQPGVLAGDPDTSAAFDGAAGEMTATTTPLPSDGDATLEGWFDWRDGVAVMRDHTTSGGWILVYDRNDSTDSMGTRIAGATYTTDRPVTSFQNGWHHFVATKRGGEVNLYVDAQRVPLRMTSPGTAAASAGPWHIMRNGRTGGAFTRGGADEIAVYASALTPGDIQRHYQLGR